MRNKNTWTICLSFFVVIMLCGIPLFNLSSYIMNILIMMLLFAFLSTAWNILGGFAGQHSLGHAAFIGVGAYTSTYLFNHYGLSPWIGMLIGGILAVLMALIMGYSAFRSGMKGPFFLLVTIASAQIIMLLVLNIRELGGASGITVPSQGHFPLLFQFESKISYYYVALSFLLLSLIISFAISKSKIGYYLIAVRENDEAAQALGINTVKFKLIATGISAFLSALGGTFYAQYILFIDPESILSLGLSIEVLVFAILGGIGTVLGPMIGAFILYPMGEFARYLWGGGTAGIHLLFYGAFLMICIIYMPQGVAGIVRNTAMKVQRTSN